MFHTLYTLVSKLNLQKFIKLIWAYKTGIGHIVSALAEGVHTISISLYDLQKTLREPKSSTFAPVRKELRKQWEDVLSYLKKCEGFGVDVFTLKELVRTEAIEDLVDFVEEMRDNAAVLRDNSRQLQDHDMSTAFLEKVKLSRIGAKHRLWMKAQTDDWVAKIFNYFSNTPQNANLKAFITIVKGPKMHETVVAIDAALLRTKSNLENASIFWDTTFTQCSTLIEQFKSGRVKMAIRDVDRIASDWRDYQEAIQEAIKSIVTTNDEILVEADVHISFTDGLRLVQLGWELGWQGRS